MHQVLSEDEAMIKTKKMTVKEINGEGRALAVIVDDLSAVDHDGDTYVAGAFSWKGDGNQWAMIVPAHQRQHMPLGKVRIYEEGGAVLAEMWFNLETQAGSEWHKTLSFDVENGNPVQEWSFGYTLPDFDFRQEGSKRIRVLKRVDVYEVSPVLRGAGLRTRTLDVKGLSLKSEQFDALLDDLETLAASLSGEPDQLSAIGMKQLNDIHRALGTALAATGEKGKCPTCGQMKEGEEHEEGGKCAIGDLDEKSHDPQAEHLIADFLLQSARRATGVCQ